MKKKYLVAVSFQVEIEAETDQSAIYGAMYKAPYEDCIRHLMCKVVVVLPIQPPNQIHEEVRESDI